MRPVVEYHAENTHAHELNTPTGFHNRTPVIRKGLLRREVR